MTDGTRATEQIDSFPYRHRVSEVMSAPISTAKPRDTLVSACRIMAEKGISSLVIVDDQGKPLGIVTERDVLRAVARSGGIGMQLPLGSVMSSPVASINANSYIYVALGRMNHHNIRHLLAIDNAGMPVGMVTARVLLKLRSTSALAIGDEIDSAPDGARMGEVAKKIPALAAALLSSGVDCASISGVVGAMLRDITGRAAFLAEQSMLTDGWGGAPVPWSLLILGSGGRGETLLAPNQNTALVHAGGPENDTWLAELGRRITDVLEAAGIPAHAAGVMAKNAKWRHGLDEWKTEIDRWATGASEADLEQAEIFFDFQSAYGDSSLADELRDHLAAKAKESTKMQLQLSEVIGESKDALGLFGQIVTEDDHLDLKNVGLMPLVAAARTLAAKYGVSAASTRDRLALLVESEHLPPSDAQAMTEAQEWFLRLILEQQLRDIDAHKTPSGLIWPEEFDKDRRARLKAMLRYVNTLSGMVKSAISG
jgi:CBS domain-containing protein